MGFAPFFYFFKYTTPRIGPIAKIR
ncbi:hypothetical protein AQ1688_170031 [Tenacibaculum maritimum]|nr:hypothetical protein AQ1688_170031 [Tenacibaculum maritimum]